MSEWYYAVNDEQKGPVNESDLKTQLATHKLAPDTLVWKDGMDDWTPANKVSAFIFREPPLPATTPVPGVSSSSSSPALSPMPSSVAHVPGAHNPESATPITMASLVGPGEALEVEPEDAENNKIMGIISYLFILWVIPLILAKDSPFAKYHANQGLSLFVFTVAIMVAKWIVDGVLGMIGWYSLEWIFGLVIVPIIYLLVVGVINAAAGKCVPLPWIGKYKLIK